MKKPFFRTYRPLKPSPNSGWSSWAFIRDRRYVSDPRSYIRPFLLIQRDLIALSRYVSLVPDNYGAHSEEIHRLLQLCCIEFVSNAKAIMAANKYEKVPSRPGMEHFSRIEHSHHLSSYEVELSEWREQKLDPFAGWRIGKVLKWWEAHTRTKHDRVGTNPPTLGDLLNAVAGLVVILSAQFRTEDFSNSSDALAAQGYSYYSFGDIAIGGLFRVKFPNDWGDESYDFDWNVLKGEKEPFAKFDYDAVELIKVRS